MRAALLLSLLPTLALAAPTVPFQGRLLDAAGGPRNGPHELRFTLWDAAEGGAPAWSETHADVPVADGTFAVRLGTVTPFAEDDWAGARWIEVSVDGEPLGARQPVDALPRAWRADDVTGDIHPASVSVGGRTVIGPDGAWAGPAPAVAVGAGLSGSGTAASPLALALTIGGGLSGSGTAASPLVATFSGGLTTATFNEGFAWSNSQRSFRLSESGGWTKMSNFDDLVMTTHGQPVLLLTSIQMNDDLGIDTGDRVAMACNVLARNSAGTTTRYRLGQQEHYAWYNFEWVYHWHTVLPLGADRWTFWLECAVHEGSAGDFQISVGNRGHEDPMGNVSGSVGTYQDTFVAMELGR
jgi:hypothetical protein